MFHLRSRTLPRRSSRASHLPVRESILVIFFLTKNCRARLSLTNVSARMATDGGRSAGKATAFLLHRINLRHFRPLLPLGHLEPVVFPKSSAHTYGLTWFRIRDLRLVLSTKHHIVCITPFYKLQ